MRREFASAARILSLPTLALLFVLAFQPGRTVLAIRIYALVLAGTVLVLMIAALRRANAPATPLRPRTRQRREIGRKKPTMLARLEDELALGVAGSFELHHHLRPRLRTLAAELLAARRRVSLDQEPQEARTLLGEETWELVRKDRPPPEDRLARGITADALGRVIESLERV